MIFLFEWLEVKTKFEKSFNQKYPFQKGSGVSCDLPGPCTQAVKSIHESKLLRDWKQHNVAVLTQPERIYTSIMLEMHLLVK